MGNINKNCTIALSRCNREDLCQTTLWNTAGKDIEDWVLNIDVFNASKERVNQDQSSCNSIMKSKK